MIKKEDFILKLYKAKPTVFTTDEICMMFRNQKRENIRSQLNYYVKQKKIKNLRKGIYAKENYNKFELATKIYTPSYISLETVLEKHGIIFQHYKTIFAISYLPRNIKVKGQEIQYRRIKKEILVNEKGLIKKGNYTIATPERAFLDALYLYSNYFFDNLSVLKKRKTYSLLSIYNSKALSSKVKKLLC